MTVQARGSIAPEERKRLATLPLAEFVPESSVVLERTALERPRFPAIDFHTHLGRWLDPDADWVAADLAGERTQVWLAADVGSQVEIMDAHGLEACVNLDGGWDAELEANLDRYDRAHPGRFHTFCQLDWRLAADDDHCAEALVASLRRSADAGARGLKIWKTLGLGFRDSRGNLLMPADQRLAAVFATAGELGLPVLIHTADPAAFFRPVDERNERLEELLAHPEWSFAGPGWPTHAELLQSFESLVAAHPQTTFVGAHIAASADDLGWVSQALGRYPNLHLDIAARRHDLGRQPRAARRLLCEHPDRVLFGTDEIPPTGAALREYFRFLESADECYPYDDAAPPLAGRWTISALELPDHVLKAVYADNARRILGASGRSEGVEQT
jgi:predicted TIM-barrel fold metal-dependent hydrolase